MISSDAFLSRKPAGVAKRQLRVGREPVGVAKRQLRVAGVMARSSLRSLRYSSRYSSLRLGAAAI